MATSKQTETLDVMRIERSQITFAVMGTSPIIFNAMSLKAQQELLMPKGKKTAAEKASMLKHDPLNEYRNSVYKARDTDPHPTRILMKSTAFKKAMMGAALDLPGLKKTQVARLLYVVGDYVPIYGVPEMMMSVVRSADMNKTPDVRTRACIPNWCAYVTVEYTTPLMKQQSVANLFAAAGQTQGIGDWRTEKGSGNYGGFLLVSEKDILPIIKTGGRAEQDAALANPTCYDVESETLLEWYHREREERGFNEEGRLTNSVSKPAKTPRSIKAA